MDVARVGGLLVSQAGIGRSGDAISELMACNLLSPGHPAWWLHMQTDHMLIRVVLALWGEGRGDKDLPGV